MKQRDYSERVCHLLIGGPAPASPPEPVLRAQLLQDSGLTWPSTRAQGSYNKPREEAAVPTEAKGPSTHN